MPICKEARATRNQSTTQLCAYFMGFTVLNSLAPGRPRCHFKTAIFNLLLLIGIFTSSKDNALRWMPRDLTDDKSTLVQVMAWCRQATSHYLSLCWPRSLSPYDVTRPQWVNSQSLSLTVKTLPSYLIATCVSCFLFLNCASQPATSVCVPSRSWS